MKSLILYFSRADENYAVGYIDKGNTEVIAEYIQELTGSDIFKVERKVPYPKEYEACTEDAKQEIDNDTRPELKEVLPSIDAYDVIYIGAPVYWSYLPQPMVTQIEKLNWEGKKVKPFITHEGSGLASIPNQLVRICPGANILGAIAIHGSQVKDSKNRVSDWVNKEL